jgi:hypothetical protein
MSTSSAPPCITLALAVGPALGAVGELGTPRALEQSLDERSALVAPRAD